MALAIALNAPVTVDGITTVVAQSADSKQYTFTAQGGTAAENRELAIDFFELLGYEAWMVEMFASQHNGNVASSYYIGRRNWDKAAR